MRRRKRERDVFFLYCVAEKKICLYVYRVAYVNVIHVCIKELQLIYRNEMPKWILFIYIKKYTKNAVIEDAECDTVGY